jgi:hypothetical protein
MVAFSSVQLYCTGVHISRNITLRNITILLVTHSQTEAWLLMDWAAFSTFVCNTTFWKVTHLRPVLEELGCRLLKSVPSYYNQNARDIKYALCLIHSLLNCCPKMKMNRTFNFWSNVVTEQLHNIQILNWRVLQIRTFYCKVTVQLTISVKIAEHASTDNFHILNLWHCTAFNTFKYWTFYEYLKLL